MLNGEHHGNVLSPWIHDKRWTDHGHDHTDTVGRHDDVVRFLSQEIIQSPAEHLGSWMVRRGSFPSSSCLDE